MWVELWRWWWWLWWAAPVAAAEPLPSGDQLVFIEDRREPLISVRLSLPAGRASPWWRRTGAAAAWHMSLQDPALRSRAAAALDVKFSHDDWQTTLQARCLRGDFPELISVLSAMLRDQAVDRELLWEWRGSRRPPWRVDDLTPQRAMQAIAARLLLPRRDPRRYPDTAVSLQPRPVRRAREQLARLPGRVVGFAGDLSASEARAGAIQLLPAPLRAAPLDVRPRLAQPRQGPPGARARARMPMPGRGWVMLTRGGLAYTDPEYPLLTLAMEALVFGGRSRMYTALRHEDGLVYSVVGETGAGPQAGLLLAAAASRPLHVEAVASRVEDLLADFSAAGLTDAERVASAAALRLEQALIDSDPDARLAQQMAAVLFGLPEDFHMKQVQAASAVSLTELNEFIARFFAPEAVSLIRVRPGPDWSLESAREPARESVGE